MKYTLGITMIAILFGSMARAEETPQSVSQELIVLSNQLPNELRSCSNNSDCAVGIMGCWQWVVVNKKYILSNSPGMFGGHFIKGLNIGCKKSHDPGTFSQSVACNNGLCGIMLPASLPQATTQDVEKASKTPQEKCGCWDSKNNICAPQSACL